jgi:hypothetical protein
MTVDQSRPGPAGEDHAGSGPGRVRRAGPPERMSILTVGCRTIRVAVREGTPGTPPLLLCIACRSASWPRLLRSGLPQDRAEDLLAGDRHVVANIGEDRRLDPETALEPRAGWPAPAIGQRGAFSLAGVDVAQDPQLHLGRDDRAEIRGRVERGPGSMS